MEGGMWMLRLSEYFVSSLCSVVIARKHSTMENAIELVHRNTLHSQDFKLVSLFIIVYIASH